MTERHLIFAAEVTASSINNFMKLLVAHAAGGTSRLVIAMNCPGGNVVAGIAAYNAAMAVPFEIIMHNIGNVDSIANAIFLAGKERYACGATTFMFHSIGFNGDANERLEEKNLKEKLDLVTADHQRMSGIIASRTSLSVREGRNLFKEQRTRGATWAKKVGIVHDIRPYIMPPAQDLFLFTE